MTRKQARPGRAIVDKYSRSLTRGRSTIVAFQLDSILLIIYVRPSRVEAMIFVESCFDGKYLEPFRIARVTYLC